MTEFGFDERLERNLRDAENTTSMVEGMKERIAGVVGADGRIKAEFTSEGPLRALDLDPAMDQYRSPGPGR